MTDLSALALDKTLGERPVMTEEDFQALVDRGEAQVWRGERSALLVRRVAYGYSGEVVLEAGPAAGDLNELLEATPKLEAWAREIGCTQAMVYAGREGWERALKQHGYEVHQIVLRKLLAPLTPEAA